jgi:hypothetical protein
MTEVAEHTVDLSLIPKRSNILDCGCRNFSFANYFRERGHRVLAIDIDDLEGVYLKVGISTESGECFVSDHADPQARKLVSEGTKKVRTMTLNELEILTGYEFDLIKLDVEGEEINLLKRWKHPVSKQVSVEFHAHCGQTKEELDELLNYLSQWYTVNNNVWESRHGAGCNYWDVLLISKT